MNIQTITTSIKKLFNAVRKPLNTVPALLMLCGAAQRPGLSPMIITSNIIRRFSEIGIPNGDNTDGTPNVYENLVRLIVEEMVRSIKMDAKIDVALPVNSMRFLGQGGNAGGPVIVQGSNITPAQGVGLMG